MKVTLLMTLPLCKTCKYYIPSPHSDFNDFSLAKCKKIGTVDVVNGEMEYSSAQSVREYACGEEGILYSPEPRLMVKQMTYTLRQKRYVFGYLLFMMVIFLQKK